MIYNIISSGSRGNAVILNEYIMIDCGVPFKALLSYYKKLEIVFLTHIHSDHFNRATIRRLAAERPTLRFACCKWLLNDLIACGVNKRNIDLLISNHVNDYGKFAVRSFDTVHDVPNCGFKFDLKTVNPRLVFYATDCRNLEGITARDFDLYMIEGNYCEKEITERIAEKEAIREYAYEKRVLNTHMSYEAASSWLFKNMNDNSEYIFLHIHE